MKHIFRFHGHWLVLLLLTDGFFAFLVWLTKPEAFPGLLAGILLFSVMAFIAGAIVHRWHMKRKASALQAFLQAPEENLNALLNVTEPCLHPALSALTEKLKKQERTISERKTDLRSYQEYIEAWVHELKTPLSLMTLVLDNHRDEMSPYVQKRMEHVRGEVGSDAQRILYYARLHADHVDYKLEPLELRPFLEECLEDFKLISEEKHIGIETTIPPLTVTSDRRALRFMLSQLFSNAFKYAAPEDGIVSVEAVDGKEEVRFFIRDNGSGAPAEDLPFLFDKGFTGSHPGRQTATGMGLYFVRQYATALSLEVQIEDDLPEGYGFGICISFPRIV